MRICQINPGCGIPIPPPSWGAIEKIVWDFTCNLKKLGYQVDIKWANEINKGDYDFYFQIIATMEDNSQVIYNANSFYKTEVNPTSEGDTAKPVRP